MFVDFLNLKKQSTSYLSPLFENTTQKVKKRKKVPLTPIEKPPKSPKTPKKQSTARWRVPSLRKIAFPRADASIARELCYFTRWKAPPLGNRRISRAVTFHRSEITESHALERSTAQKSQNPKRGSIPPPRNRKISRIGWFRCTRTMNKNLIE